MKFTDDFTVNEQAAADFEAGRAPEMSRRELAEEAGFDRYDDTLGRPPAEPPTGELADALARATRAIEKARAARGGWA